MQKWFKPAIAGAVLTGGVALSGQVGAMVIIEEGPGNFAGDSNVLFNACGGTEVTGPALTVTGCLNSDNSFLIDFMSDENLVADAGGQARVEAADGRFEYLKISVRTALGSVDYSTLITNINASDFVTGQPGSGQVEITAYIDGSFAHSEIFDLGDSGQNFFRLSHDDDALFSAVEFRALNGAEFDNVDFEDFRQTRLGGLRGPEKVSESAPVALLGLGLLALGAATKRRNKS